MLYNLVKTLHILSATLLFGAGLSTAFHLLWAWLSGETRFVAHSARTTVLADWLFTLGPGLFQPLSGLLLIDLAGFDPAAPWLLLTYGLYVLALACWLPVVRIQLRLAQSQGEPGATQRLLMRQWMRLGWPAFFALIAIFYLMVAKPPLWES